MDGMVVLKTIAKHLNPSADIPQGALRPAVSHSVVSNSLRPPGLWPTRLLCPWDSPGQNTGVHRLSFLQGIFPTPGSNPGLLRGRQTLFLSKLCLLPCRGRVCAFPALVLITQQHTV